MKKNWELFFVLLFNTILQCHWKINVLRWGKEDREGSDDRGTPRLETFWLWVSLLLPGLGAHCFGDNDHIRKGGVLVFFSNSLSKLGSSTWKWEAPFCLGYLRGRNQLLVRRQLSTPFSPSQTTLDSQFFFFLLGRGFCSLWKGFIWCQRVRYLDVPWFWMPEGIPAFLF